VPWNRFNHSLNFKVQRAKFKVGIKKGSDAPFFYSI